MDNNLHLVVMAGGTGTRLWPQSRQHKPKQFLDILGTGRSLLQATCDRFNGLIDVKNQVIASNETYTKLLREQLPKFSKTQFFLEPSKRNTAPCIAYAAYKIASKDPDAVMVITPADSAIFYEGNFLRKIQLAVEAAREDKLVTIGIQPDRPETGYGYIQYIESDEQVKKVKTFTEKPEADLAEKFIESGDFVWNAGIFVWKVSSIIQAFETHVPEMAEIFSEGSKLYYTRKEKKFINQAYSQCRNISIDYAIMEKSDNVHCVLGDFGWSDLGSWQTIHEYRNTDENNNSISGDALLKDCSNNLIELPDGKLGVIEGLEDYLIADMDDALVIVPKSDPARFQRIVRDIKRKKGEDLL